MDSNQWQQIVKACQQGDSEYILHIIQNPPENIRFNKLIKIALQYQQWQVIEALLPVWDCNKSPRIFHLAAKTPLHIIERAWQILKGTGNVSQARKDCISAVGACVVHEKAHSLQFLIDQLRGMKVFSLHDPVLWRGVGQSSADIYTTLVRNFNPDATVQAQVFFTAIAHGNWEILRLIPSTVLHPDDFLEGLVRSVRLGKRGVVDHYLPHLTIENLHTIIKKSVESGFAVNRSRELNVWLNLLPDLTHLGPVVENLLKCAIGLNDLDAVKKLAPYYTPAKTDDFRHQHPLGWVINNLAGSFDPDHSLDMVHILLLCHPPSDPLLAQTAHTAVSRRGEVTLPHLDAVCAYSTYPDIDRVAFTGAVLQTNAAAVKHLMPKISDADFLKALSEVKTRVGGLENLQGWNLLEPFIQPRILHLALAENHTNDRAIKRKI